MKFWITDGILHHEKTVGYDYHNQEYLIYPDEGVSLELNEGATELIIPKGVRCIGFKAFYARMPEKKLWKKLKKVILPDSIEEIGERAFENCISLDEINLPEGLKVLCDDCFQHTALKGTLRLPESLIKLGDRCFALSFVEKIVFPKSETEISYNALQDLPNIKSIEVPAYVKHSLSFSGDSALCEIKGYHPKAEQTFEGFVDCKSLKSIIIPEGTKGIGVRALDNCSSLEEIIIPKSVKDLTYVTFRGCTGLKKVVFKGAAKAFESAFPDSPGIVRVEISEEYAGKAKNAFPKADIYSLKGELLFSVNGKAGQGKLTVKNEAEQTDSFRIVDGELFPESSLPKFVKGECILHGLKHDFHIVLPPKTTKEINSRSEDIYTMFNGTGIWAKYNLDPHYYDISELIEANNGELYYFASNVGETIPVFEDDYECKYSEPLPKEEINKRYRNFIGLIVKCLEITNLQKILEYIPHKKDGTLAKKRVTVIAKNGFADSNGMCDVFVAKNDTDLDIKLELRSMYIGEENYQSDEITKTLSLKPVDLDKLINEESMKDTKSKKGK